MCLVLTSAAAVRVDVELVPAGVDVAAVGALAGGEVAVVALVLLPLLPQPAVNRATATVVLYRARRRFT
jgi:hypothetical protein